MKRFLGFLVVRKMRWGLSLWGWLVIGIVALACGFFVLTHVQRFLAVNEPVSADILVVEGWIHQYAANAGALEFKTNNYRKVFTTGGPVSWSGSYSSDYDTTAHVGESRLLTAGVPKDCIESVPARGSDRDRTFLSASALASKFNEMHFSPRSLNVVTESTHARRTRLLFQRALGPGVKVGIISVANPDYDASRWWKYSEGVRDVVSEVLGYVYARLFSPSHDGGKAGASQGSVKVGQNH